MPRIRIHRKTIAAGCLSILLLLAFSSVVLHLPAAQSRVFRFLASRALDAAGIVLETDSFRYNLFLGKAELRSLKIRTASASGMVPLAEIHSAKIRFRTLSLAKGLAAVTRIHLEHPSICIRLGPDGKANLPTRQSSAASSFSSLPDEIFIEGGSLRIEDVARALDLHLPGLLLKFNKGEDGHDIEWTGREAGILRIRQESLPIREIQFSGRLVDSDLNVGKFEVQAGKSRLAARGQIRSMDNPVAAITLESQCNLAELSKLVNWEQSLDGNLAITAQITGPLKGLVADVTGEFTALRFPDLDPFSGSASIQYRRSSEDVILKDLRARSAVGEMSATGSISFSGEKKGEVRAALLRIRLAELLDRVKGNPLPAASMSGSVELSWQDMNWRTAIGQARLTLVSSDKAPRGRSVPLDGSVNIRLSAKDLQIRIPALSGPGFHLAADLRTDRSLEYMKGNATGEVHDVEALLRAAHNTWPQQISSAQVPVGGGLQFDAQLDGSLRAPHVITTIRSEDFRAGAFAGMGLDGSLEYRAGRLQLNKSWMTWRNQNSWISGTLDLAGKNSPAYEFQAGIDEISLKELWEGFGFGGEVSGSIGALVTGRGSFANPELAASLRGIELSAFGERLGSLEANARLSGARVMVDSMRLEKPQQGNSGIVEGSGEVDWGGDELHFQVRSNEFRIESMALPDHIPIRGVLSLEANTTGSLSNPQWFAKVGVQALSVAGWSVENIKGSFEGTGTAGNIVLELPDYGTNLHGQIDLVSPYPAHLVMDTVGLDLSRFSAILSDRPLVDGSVTLHMEANGPLTRPVDSSARISLKTLDAGLAGYRIRNRSTVEVEWKDQNLIIHSAALESGDGGISISGSMPLRASVGEGDLALDGSIPLSLLKHITPAARDYGIKGVARIQGSLKGALEEIHPSISFSASEGALKIPGLLSPITDISIEAGADASGIFVRRLGARIGNGTIQANGTFPFQLFSREKSTAPMKLEIELAGLNPAETMEGFQTLNGSIGLQASLEAARADLRNLRGTIALSELKLKTGNTEAEQAGNTRLSIDSGRITIDHLSLKGSAGTSLQGSGWISFLDDRAIDLKLMGSANAELFSAGRKDFGLDGIVVLKLDISGTLKDPRMNGAADLSKGRFFLANPPLSASNLSAHAEFANDRIQLTHLTGQLNGGSLEAEGSARFSKAVLGNLHFKAVAENLFLDYPKGLRTVSNVKLDARSEGESFLLEGTAELVQGVYREAVDLASMQQETTPPATEKNTISDRVRFNIHVHSDGPLAVDNNLARIEAYADVRLVGTARHPSLRGRIELEEGGRVYVSERTFTISHAVVSFANEQRIEPILDLRADTRIGEYLISFNANGGLKDMDASFTADPAASEEQIQSLLLTGSPDNTDKVTGGTLASRSALSLFGSTMVGGFNMRVRQVLGFSDFRIEPSLISADSDPTARLTVGQNLTPELGLTYSTNLRNSNDQIWIVEYDWRRNVIGRYVNRSEDSDRGEIRHRIRFGGGPDTGDLRTSRRTRDGHLESIQITGNAVFPESVVHKELNLRPGQRWNAIEVQKRVEQLTRFYHRKDYLEVTIRQERLREQDKVQLKLLVDAGHRISFLFEGAEIPKSIQRDIAKVWQSGIVDSERLRSASDLIRRYLFRKKFCDAEVSAVVEPGQDSQKIVKFQVSPGFRYERVLIEFPGLDSWFSKRLRHMMKRYNLESEIFSNPFAVQQVLVNQLREQGYLTSTVTLPRLRRDQDQATYSSVIPVRPGPRYRLGEIRFEGNQDIASKDLRKAIEMRAGDLYVPSQLGSLTQDLGSLYWREGYRGASAYAVEQPDSASGRVNLLFKIREYRQATIADIQVSGNVKTSEDFLLRRIPFKKGDAIDGEKLDLLRRRLTNSGSYNAVDLTLPPAAEAEQEPDAQPLDLMIRVREPKPFSFEYGVIYDTERKAGFVLDGGVRNILGEGRRAGYRITGDQNRLDQRVYFTQKFMGRRDIATDLDLAQENSTIDELDILKRRFSIQQQIEFRRKFTFTYGYQIKNTKTTYSATRSALTKSSDTTSPLIVALTRDTRDDVFDATRGSYTSQAFEYGPTFLGGNLPYYRYFGQYSKYFGLRRPAVVSFVAGERSRYVFATGVRVGFMGALEDRDFTPGDLFFGGGSTSIRGFRQNSLGPQLDGQSLGGQAVFFLNNEFRAPLYKWVEAVTFLDIGNVFEKPSDFRISGIRKSAGVGVRIRNPFIIIRFDYGWKLDRASGESPGAFHFGIGQAF